MILEKHADVLIADHARKDTPPGSISWKYITESIAKGELVNIDDHRIHHANLPRPVGSSAPTRGIRVPFTPMDERILVTWVRQNGAHTRSGNEIYKTLAESV